VAAVTDREQIRRVCQWNRTLACENARLREALCRKEQECRRLSDANADLGAELDACDGLLGTAMDRLLEGSNRL
jgi:hypothetical protein